MIFGLFRSFFMCDYFYNRTKFCVIIFQITQDLVKIASCREIMKLTTHNFVYDIYNHTTSQEFSKKIPPASSVIWNIVHEIWCRYFHNLTIWSDVLNHTRWSCVIWKTIWCDYILRFGDQYFMSYCVIIKIITHVEWFLTHPVWL